MSLVANPQTKQPNPIFIVFYFLFWEKIRTTELHGLLAEGMAATVLASLRTLPIPLYHDQGYGSKKSFWSKFVLAIINHG